MYDTLVKSENKRGFEQMHSAENKRGSERTCSAENYTTLLLCKHGLIENRELYVSYLYSTSL